jgi:hypothetical protein
MRRLPRRLQIVVLSVVVSIAGVFVSPGVAHADPRYSTYEIVNEQNGLCLTVPGGNTADYTIIQGQGCNGTGNGQWRFDHWYSPQNDGTLKCLDAGAPGESNYVYEITCNYGQNWGFNYPTCSIYVRCLPGFMIEDYALKKCVQYVTASFLFVVKYLATLQPCDAGNLAQRFYLANEIDY